MTQKRIVNVGVNALAREVGLTPATISKKMKAGMTAEQIRQEAARKKGLPPVGNSHGPGRPIKPKKSEYDLIIKGRERINDLDDAKLRRAQALAERSELDNMVRRGELIPVSYVRTWASRFLTDGRDTLLAGPSELQDALAAESDPLKVNAIMRSWLERAMAKFHKLDGLWGADAEGKVA